MDSRTVASSSDSFRLSRVSHSVHLNSGWLWFSGTKVYSGFEQCVIKGSWLINTVWYYVIPAVCELSLPYDRACWLDINHLIWTWNSKCSWIIMQGKHGTYIDN